MSGKGNLTAQFDNQNLASVYDAFKRLVTGSEIQDGDVRLNAATGTLEKVNFGGLFRRKFSLGSSLCNQQAGNSSEIKELFLRALRDKVNGLAALTVQQKTQLIDRLKAIVGDAGNVALSRRTISLAIQMVEDEGVSAQEKGTYTGESKRLGRRAEETYNGVVWKMVGGRRGMRMSKDQFANMFKSAMAVAVKNNAALKLGLEAELKYYMKLFESGNNGADLEQYFYGSLDLNTIADKMIKHLQDGLVPSLTTKDRSESDCKGVISKNLCNKIRQVKEDEMALGSEEIRSKVDTHGLFAGEVENVLPPVGENAPMLPEPERRKEIAAAKNFVADLLLSSDMRELAFSGLTDGERIGRLLFKNVKTFCALCRNVLDREAIEAANAKNPKKITPVPDESEELKAIRLVSDGLADDFTRLLSHLAKDVLKIKPTTSEADFSAVALDKADRIFSAIGEFKPAVLSGTDKKGFESVIEHRLSERLHVADESGYSLPERLFQTLAAEYIDGSDVNAVMFRVLLEKASPSTMRRMFALSLRESPSHEMTAPDETWLYPGLIRGLGPLAMKLLQSVKHQKINADDLSADLDPYGIRAALKSATGKCAKLNPEVVRTIVYDVLKMKGVAYDSVEITGVCGQGSVAQAMKCKVKKGALAAGGKDDEIILKIIRPDIKDEFDAEVGILRDFAENGWGTDLGLAILGQDGSQDVFAQKFKDRLAPLVNDISVEINPKNELINALKGLKTYGQPQVKGVPVVPFKSSWSFGNGKIVETSSTISVGSERLVVKSEVDLTNPSVKAELQRAIDACVTDEQFKAVLEKYFVCDNPYVLLIETAAGVNISDFIDDCENKVDELVKSLKPAGQDPDDAEISAPSLESLDKEIVTKRNELVKMSRSFAVLAEKFVENALFAPQPFFHGDLQPGNIRYDMESGEIILIDYGKATSLSPAECDALKTLVQLEGCKSTPVDAELILEAYLKMVDVEIERLSASGTDPEKLAALQKAKTDLSAGGSARIREKTLQSFRDFPEGNLFDSLVSALQNGRLPVPVSLMTFAVSYSILNTTAERIKQTLEAYDTLINGAINVSVGEYGIDEALSALTDVSGDNALPLDYIGSVDCKVTAAEGGGFKVTVSESEIPGGLSRPMLYDRNRDSPYQILSKLHDTISSTCVTPHQRKVAALDAKKLLEHEKKRLSAFQEQFTPEKLKATLKNDYGITDIGSVEIGEMKKCSDALKAIDKAIKGLDKLVATLNAEGVGYDDTVSGTEFVESSVDEKFGSEASEWRLREPVAGNIDLVLSSYCTAKGKIAKIETSLPKVWARFEELTVQSGLSWPKQSYLLSLGDDEEGRLAVLAFDYLTQLLSGRLARMSEQDRDEKEWKLFGENDADSKWSLGFDEREDHEVDSDWAGTIRRAHVNGLKRLASDLKISGFEDLTVESFKPSKRTWKDPRELFLEKVEELSRREIPDAGAFAGSYADDRAYLDAEEVRKNVSKVRFLAMDTPIVDLPSQFKLKQNYETLTSRGFGNQSSSVDAVRNCSVEQFVKSDFTAKLADDGFLQGTNVSYEDILDLRTAYGDRLAPGETFGFPTSYKMRLSLADAINFNCVDYAYALRASFQNANEPVPEVVRTVIDLYEKYCASCLTVDFESSDVGLLSAKECGLKAGEKSALDIYDDLLKSVNSGLPSVLKIVRPNRVTFKDLKALQEHLVPLKDVDRKEFDRKLELLSSLTPDSGTLVAAYRAKKTITRGDFLRLSATVGSAFTRSWIAADTIREKYLRVREFIADTLSFEPPPYPEGQITLKAYRDILADLCRLTKHFFTIVRRQTRLGKAQKSIAGKVNSFVQDDNISIGECKQRFDALFDTSDPEKGALKRLNQFRNVKGVKFKPLEEEQQVSIDGGDPAKLNEQLGNLDKLNKLNEMAEKCGLPPIKIVYGQPVPIEDVRRLLRDIRELAKTQPKLNNIQGIVANRFRVHRNTAGQHGGGAGWDLAQNDDSTINIHFKTYRPLKLEELRFDGESGRSLWEEGADGKLKTGMDESFIAYNVGLTEKCVETSPELKDRKDRQRAIILEKVRNEYRDKYCVNEKAFDNDEDFNQYMDGFLPYLKGSAADAVKRLFWTDTDGSYTFKDKIFDTMRERIMRDPKAFELGETVPFDEKNDNHIMLLEVWLRAKV